MSPPADADKPTELQARVEKLEAALDEGNRAVLSKAVDKSLRLLPVFAISNVAVAVPAFLISIGVAYFTFVQAEATQKMQIASVWPHVEFDTGNTNDAGDPLITMNVTNQGVGPARIEGMEVSYGGKSFADGPQLVRACCLPHGGPLILVSSSLNGQVLPAGKEIAFLKATRDDLSPEVYSRLNKERLKVRVRVCYCSVFDDCWIEDSQAIEQRQVKQCPADWTQYDFPQKAPARP